ncbi:MBL fold metallo-hydrolase [Corynebacterium callunae]|uniref:MBL fold metallo-hydrolase n=1 Tax=Corynebacterium callunae TaxID=1721 RepID=UPI001FFEC621|nr:MBL fold metallo-hydrolase [Corynebacterium callunae]MCK2199472.1 MBL fold metallo-hydrolase [Corynebacterium callunae]
MNTPIHSIYAPWGRFGLYTFLIDGPEMALVDTGVTATVQGVADGLEKLGRDIKDVKWILLTHGHIDHLGGTVALWEMTGRQAKVVIHQDDVDYLQRRRAHVENYLNLRAHYIDDPEAEEKQTAMMEHAISGEMSPQIIVKGGEILDLGGVKVRVVHTPGHTSGSVAYVVEGQEDVFVGDAVQIHGAANGFPGYEDPDAYRKSLLALQELELNRMFLGHPFRSVAGEPYAVELDKETSAHVLTEALEIEARVRTAAQELGAAPSESLYSPYAAIAERLGYEGDPRLEPSPFFTTLHGYLS